MSRIDIMSSLSNRTYCDCLIEMRDYLNVLQEGNQKFTNKNKWYLICLVEELQTYGNRMESAIYDYKEILRTYRTYKKLKVAVRKKKGQLTELEDKIIAIKEKKRRIK